MPNLTLIAGLGGSELIILFFFFILGFIPFLIAFIDVLRSEFTGNNKIIWVLVVLFVPLGWLFYFLIGRKQRLGT